jgi:hypothetical protein
VSRDSVWTSDPTPATINAQAGVAAGSDTCARCGGSFTPRRGGSVQRFCCRSCRIEFHTAARQQAAHDIAAGRAAGSENGSPVRAACTLPECENARAPYPRVAAAGEALYDRPMRFLVEVPASTVDGLIRLGLLGSGQREDLIAILTAVKRLGRQPDVYRIA